MAICGLGAVKVRGARHLYAIPEMRHRAGAGGAAVGALLNYALTSMFTWGGVCRERRMRRTFAAT